MFDVTAVTATAELSAMVSALGRLDPAVDDAERVQQLRLLEQMKSAAAAAQATVTAAFAASQRQLARAAGAPAERAERSIVHQIALARRMSPHRAAREASWAKILTAELPNTLGALQRGLTTEWRALLIARETAWLSRDHRVQVDRDLAAQLEGLGDRRVEREARRRAYALDPAGAAARLASAPADRRVTLRPAPDAMSWLTALLPVEQGVAAYAALLREAESKRSAGDFPRARTDHGRHAGRAGHRSSIGSRRAGGDRADHAGTDPARRRERAGRTGGRRCDTSAGARRLATGSDASTAPRWLRRLYRLPGSRELIAMESRRRCFTPAQRRFVRLRDGTCRTPWCDAPIRQVDHIIPADSGGPTSIVNAEGLCEACNYAKQAPGWSTQPAQPTQRACEQSSEVLITTPTGHRYRSKASQPPGTAPPFVA